MIEVCWSTATSAGRVRPDNQDCLLAAPPVFLVADGMGGRAGGAEASRLAVAAFRPLTRHRPAAGADRRGGEPSEVEWAKAAQARAERVSAECVEMDSLPTAEEVLAAVEDANRSILGAAGRLRYDGMGTTLVGLCLVIEAGTTYWLGFNIGDSRLYRLADGRLEQVSTDHSEVQELIGAGLIASDQRRGHPRGHLITRALGIHQAPRTDCWLLEPVVGERFLLCSDGLTDEVADELIADLLAAGPEPAEAAELLVQAAVEAGGRDNVTVVVLEVRGETG